MKILKALFLVFCLTIFANAQKATLTGTVYDQQGAVIPGTLVKILDKNKKEYLAKSNDEGIYQIDLPANIYSIEVTADGFEKFKINQYRIVLSYKGKQVFDFGLTGKMTGVLTIN